MSNRFEHKHDHDCPARKSGAIREEHKNIILANVIVDPCMSEVEYDSFCKDSGAYLYHYSYGNISA